MFLIIFLYIKHIIKYKWPNNNYPISDKNYKPNSDNSKSIIILIFIVIVIKAEIYKLFYNNNHKKNKPK